MFFRLSKGDRVGLIGRNGAGKTTILRLILGQEEPTEGTVEVNDDVKIGYFSQFSELNGEKSILDVLEELFAHIHAIEEELFEIGCKAVEGGLSLTIHAIAAFRQGSSLISPGMDGQLFGITPIAFTMALAFIYLLRYARMVTFETSPLGKEFKDFK